MDTYEHIFLPSDFVSSEPFTTTMPGRGTARIPLRDRATQAQQLVAKFDAIRSELNEVNESRQALLLPTKGGSYLEFSSGQNYDLITKSLEDSKLGIRLLSARTVFQDNTEITKAIVYVPQGKESLFIKKISDYSNPQKDTIKGNPKNSNLVDSIEDVRLAVLESFWPISERDLIPNETPFWCEAWLRVDEDKDYEAQIGSFVDILNQNDIPYKGQFLHFPERAIILINANRAQLIELMMESDLLSEYRIGQEVASFWSSDCNRGQTEWAEDLLQRMQIEDTDVKVCILDSGVNNGHMLINPILDDENCLTIDQNWGTDDRSDIGGNRGHGTLMAGLVGYGNLQKELESPNTCLITHQLCSVKILPNRGQTEKENWGDFTEQAISRSEIQNPNKILLYCLAVTSDSDVDRGRPSSWSGTIDRMSFGENLNQRLFILSGGNVPSHYWLNYPEGNKLFSVQNPAQSWNALTVGAYTEKEIIQDNRYDRSRRIADSGALSPHSSTSCSWGKWPIKPEVLFEGGNLIKTDANTVDFHEDLELLTTAKNFTLRQFDTINATSAATAQASWVAAKIAYKYPTIWPETIRALIVHSASWTEQMKTQFPNPMDLLRACGYGVPNTDRALYSFENRLTFVAQEVIQPYIKKGNAYKTNEMHFYNFPWPKDLLLSLGSTPIKLKITLSYFIEPSPGEIGWKDKYRYPSFGLRFDLNRVNEDVESFKRRINKEAQQEDENIENIADRQNWIIGSKKRVFGSIHSDIWEGTAAEIADCNLISVFPVIGWWRERHNLRKYNNRGRYALIVSIDTPVEDVQLYSTVQTMIQIPIEVTAN
ncbi:hypothetical protein EZS27_012184 [termite gut metagenome]|uniref:Peptidase S8/S53 domain-containing protein n=1 Tax=termite gut metagenome TaxID=433724 RepID=A0A5J4S3Y0_9ZZZZ